LPPTIRDCRLSQIEWRCSGMPQVSSIPSAAKAFNTPYNIAAGVFAGMVPARVLLALPFFRGTAKSTIAALKNAALDALGGAAPRREGGATFMSVFRDSVARPVTTLQWGVDCGVSAFELATQMAGSAVAAALPR